MRPAVLRIPLELFVKRAVEAKSNAREIGDGGAYTLAAVSERWCRDVLGDLYLQWGERIALGLPTWIEPPPWAESAQPACGVGATLHLLRDRYPATVISVSPSGKTISIQIDRRPADTTIADYLGAPHTGPFVRDPDAAIFKARLKDGLYCPVGHAGFVVFGVREHYRYPYRR